MCSQGHLAWGRNEANQLICRLLSEVYFNAWCRGGEGQEPVGGGQRSNFLNRRADWLISDRTLVCCAEVVKGRGQKVEVNRAISTIEGLIGWFLIAIFVYCAEVVKGKTQKVEVSMAGAREETETALNVCIQHVLKRTGIKANQVTLPLRPCIDIAIDNFVHPELPESLVLTWIHARLHGCTAARLHSSAELLEVSTVPGGTLQRPFMSCLDLD